MAWIKQRSRWIKGYMQTWLVYMRHPRTLYRTLSPSGFWGFQFFVGGPCLVFLSAPFLWFVSALWATGLILPGGLPLWLLAICLGVLVMGGLCHIALALASIRHWRFAGMLLPALFFPFYWFLHSVASLRALWQLIFRPHFWEKTTHNLSKQPVIP
jgi:cellulose synthase/poly-beta-1,6-N-acetylglucosamine synthase-like glycosyltransferase